MNIAIIIFLTLSIFSTGTLTIKGHKININWICIIALVLFIIQMLK